MLRRLRYCVILCLILPGLLVSGLQLLPLEFAALSELARFVPYYWIFPPALMALPLLWRAPGWLIGLAGAANVLIVVVAMGLTWSFPEPAVQGGHPLSVMTFNTKSDKVQYIQGELTALDAEIRTFDADIIALQDADGLMPGVSQDTPTKLGRFAMFPEAFAMGQYVLASRFPIAACHSISLGDHERSQNALSCDVDVNGTVVTVVVVHFLSPRYAFLSMRQGKRSGWTQWRENLADRLSQADIVLKEIANRKNVQLILGDFNAREGSPVVQKFLAYGMRDAFGEAGRGLGLTYGRSEHKHLDFVRIDHILVSPEVVVNEASVGVSRLSDHQPVRTVLSLKRSSR